MAMLGDLVLLPQILASPLGLLFVPRPPKADAAETTSTKPPQLAQIDAAA
jgi:hypothetical protein